MRILLLSIVLLAVEPAPPSDYPIAAVPMTEVRIEDDFWRPRMDVNRTVSIPHIMRQNEATGRVVTAIPYFAWANRGRGEMAVWIPYR